MNKVLRLWLSIGGVCDLILPEREAMEIFERFRSRWYHAANKLSIDGVTADDVPYSFTLEKIIGMVVIPALPGNVQPVGKKNPWGRSGN